MRYFILLSFFVVGSVFFNKVLANETEGKDFTLRAHFDAYKDRQVLVAYYNGTGWAVYDSLRIDDNGEAVHTFKNTLPGLYSIVIPVGSQQMIRDIVLDKDTLISFNMDEKGVMLFPKGSDNDIFYSNAQQLQALSAIVTQRSKEYADVAKQQTLTKKQAERYEAAIKAAQKNLDQALQSFKTSYPTHILTLMNSMRSAVHFSSELKTDKDTLAYRQLLKNNYFNDAIWQDARIRRLSVFYDYLNDYFNNVVEKDPDSLTHYVDLIARRIAQDHPALLLDIARFIHTHYVSITPFLGSDAIFYRLYTQYLRDDKRPIMLTAEGLRMKQYGEMVADNQINAPAPDFLLMDAHSEQQKKSGDFSDSAYYLLCFWDPHCYHCRKALPDVDSLLFEGGLAQRYHIKAIGITLDETNGLDTFLKQKNIHPQWTHLYDNTAIREEGSRSGIKNFRISYGIFQTPTFYLLDSKKRIIAKNFNYKQLPRLFKMLRPNS